MKRNLLLSLLFGAALLASVEGGKIKTRLGRHTSLTQNTTLSTGNINVTPDHVVIVIMENHSFSQIIGSPQAPNINALAASGASIVSDPGDPTVSRSGSHALRHPSQPNYLELYSGNNQGTLQDGLPGTPAEPLSPPLPFNAPNLGASLLHAGYSFTTYSEDLPAVGSNVETNGSYARKHNPAVNWQSIDASSANTHLPPALNQPFFPLSGQPGTGFPTDFSKLPTVSIVVPNQQNDMHDGTVAQGDAWLKANIIDTYLAWAMTHNSLLIVTFDEDGDNTASNQIPTIFAGPMIKSGNYTEKDLNINNPDTRPPDGFITPTGTAMNHYNLLSTIEDLYGLPHIGGSINRPPVSDVFLSSLIVRPLVVPNTFGGAQGDTGNLFPLFSAKPIRYQQVYDALQFSRFAAGGEMINSIAFRAHTPAVPFTGTIPQLQVNLSTTSKAPDNLGPTFAANIGSDDTQVFSGPVNVVVTASGPTNGPTAFDVVIKFTTPFLYDPTKGNLLVDIRNAQGGTEDPALDQELDASNAAGDSVSRVYNYGDVNAAAAGQTGGNDEVDTLGLITQFGTNASPATTPVHLTSVISRKTHGNAGVFDVDLPLSGNRGVECRSGGANGNHTMIFTFANTLTHVSGAAVTSGTGTVTSSAIGSDAHQYIVDLANVTNAQTITVTLTNVTDSGGNSSSLVSASMSVLLGDSTGDGFVNSADISETKSQSGAAITSSNFREDLNADGFINSADISLVKSMSGTGLP